MITRRSRAGSGTGTQFGPTTRRVAMIALCLLVMIPAALAYAGGGLLSGFPSSATVGDKISFSPSLEDDEKGDLEVSVSPSSGASLSKSGDSFSVTFSKAGSYTISAKAGDRSDKCSVSVKEAEEQSDDSDDDEDGDSTSGGDDTGDDSGGGDGDEDGDSTSGDDGSDDDDGTSGDDGSGDDGYGDGTDSDNGRSGGQGNGGSMPSGSMSKKAGGMGSARVSGGMSGSTSGSGSTGSTDDSKTTYTGSEDNYLDALKVKGHKFSQGFHKTNDTYFMTVSSGTESIDVTAKASDSDAEVVITGDDALTTGRNKVMVSVTAENGAVRVYRIYVDVK